MKNNKVLKISLLILSLALCLGAMFAMSISAEGTQPEIIAQNVKYTDKFAIMYAVDASTVSGGSVTLNVYEKMPTETSTPKKSFSSSKVVTAEGNLKKDSYIITTDGVPATELTKLFYVQAVDADGNKSEVKRYSVAEYLYERLAGADANQTQRDFYNSTIAFGTSAQKVIGKVSNKDLYIDNYRLLKVEGGTIDGFTQGVYPMGTELTPDDTSVNWCIVTYDAIGDFTSTPVTNGKFVVGDGVSNKLTTKVITYKDGFESMNKLTVASMPYNSTTRLTSDGRFYRGNGHPAIEYVNAGEHGIVAKFNLTAGGDAVKIMPNVTTVAAANAKAFECSFDIKMITPGSKESEPIEIFFYSGGGSRFRMNLYTRYDDTGVLVVNSPNNGKVERKWYYDQPDDDWFNVRAVIYADDLTKAYFYINGDEVGHCNNYAGGTVDFTQIGFGIRQYSAGYYSKEVTVKDEAGNKVLDEAGNEVKETVWYGDPNDEVYALIDNYYCGYTMEENPYTPAG